MSLTKTPTSSLSAFELLVKRVWCRTLARIRRAFSVDASLEISTARPSPAPELPQEIVDVIIVHLIYDTRSLLACSLTCYTWYIAAVPHLHHTLITPTYYHWDGDKKFMWPKPLRSMHKLGLLPFVKKFQIHRRNLQYSRGFSPKMFNCRTVHHFLALTNVRELGIDYLDIPSFMPRIRRYFGHFLPTVQSLALRGPEGTHRQIVYFIGMFEHLEDLKLLYDATDSLREEPADDQTLIPLFIPPLRGRLTMMHTRVGVLKGMIDLFGGIRFRYMDVFDVEGMRLLLGACAETLETLRLYPTDPCVNSPKWDFDLSRNKSLRAIEIRVRYIDGAWRAGSLNAALSLPGYALTTIRSPVFSEVVVFYRDSDFPGISHPWSYWPTGYLSRDEAAEEAVRHDRRFQVLRLMRLVREFQLVLCADVWDGAGEYSVRTLKRVLAAPRTKFVIFREPTVIYSPRGSRQHPAESLAGHLNPWIPL